MKPLRSTSRSRIGASVGVAVIAILVIAFWPSAAQERPHEPLQGTYERQDRAQDEFVPPDSADQALAPLVQRVSVDEAQGLLTLEGREGQIWKARLVEMAPGSLRAVIKEPGFPLVGAIEMVQTVVDGPVWLTDGLTRIRLAPMP